MLAFLDPEKHGISQIKNKNKGRNQKRRKNPSLAMWLIYGSYGQRRERWLESFTSRGKKILESLK